MRLFSDPRCTCDAKHAVLAVLEGRDPDLCPVHQVDELERLEAEHARADTDEKIALLRDAKDTLHTLDELDDRRRQREQAETERAAGLAELDQSDPLLATIVRRVGAPIPAGSTLPLNAPPSAYPALTGLHNADERHVHRAPRSHYRPRNPDGPDAA